MIDTSSTGSSNPTQSRPRPISPLRQRFIEHLILQQKAARTVQDDTSYVADLAQFHGQSPDQLGQPDIRSWILHLITERKLSASSVNIAINSLRVLFSALRLPGKQPAGPADSPRPGGLGIVPLATGGGPGQTQAATPSGTRYLSPVRPRRTALPRTTRGDRAFYRVTPRRRPRLVPRGSTVAGSAVPAQFTRGVLTLGPGHADAQTSGARGRVVYLDFQGLLRVFVQPRTKSGVHTLSFISPYYARPSSLRCS